MAGIDTVAVASSSVFLQRIKDFGIKKCLTFAGNTLWKVYEMQSLKGLKQWQTHPNYWIFFSLQLGGKVTVTVLFFLYSALSCFSLSLHPKKRHYSNPHQLNRDYTYGSLKWLIKKEVINWFTDMAEWVKWHHIPSWAFSVTMCARVFNSISSMAAQYFFFFWSRVGQQPYLPRHCPSGSPSTQHGQQSRMCVCEREKARVLVCAEQAHWYSALHLSPFTIALQFHHPRRRFDRQFLLLENLEGASRC